MPRAFLAADWSTWGVGLSSLTGPELVARLKMFGDVIHDYASDGTDMSAAEINLAEVFTQIASAPDLLPTLIQFARKPDVAGGLSTEIIADLLRAAPLRPKFVQFPGLVDAMVASPHLQHAFDALDWLCDHDEVGLQAVIQLGTQNSKLLAKFMAGVSDPAVEAMGGLCKLSTASTQRGGSGLAATLYNHPGLVDLICRKVENILDARIRIQKDAADAELFLTNLSHDSNLQLSLVKRPAFRKALLCMLKHGRFQHAQANVASNMCDNLSRRMYVRELSERERRREPLLLAAAAALSSALPIALREWRRERTPLLCCHRCPLLRPSNRANAANPSALLPREPLLFAAAAALSSAPFSAPPPTLILRRNQQGVEVAELVRDDLEVILKLIRFVSNKFARRAVYRFCAPTDQPFATNWEAGPDSEPSLAEFVKKKFYNQLPILRALVQLDPAALLVMDKNGLLPIDVATKAGLGKHELELLQVCTEGVRMGQPVSASADKGRRRFPLTRHSPYRARRRR